MKRYKNFLLASLLVLIDQISKYIIRRTGGFYICNKNIAFGIAIPNFLFWVFWIVIIFYLSFLIYRKYQAPEAKFYVLILAGAFGNIIDRLRLGCITDFIDLKFWPVFNLADSFITIGVLLLLFRSFRQK